MNKTLARIIVGSIIGFYVATLSSAWPTIEPIMLTLGLAFLGMFVGTILALLTQRVNWILFGLMVGGVVGVSSSLLSWQLFWTMEAPKYEDIILNPATTLIRAILRGLPVGLIIGGLTGFIADYVAKRRSEQSEAKLVESLPATQSNGALVPEGITKILLLLLSFFVTIAGIVIGIIYLKRPDTASQQFAKQVFIATGAGFILVFLYTLI